MYNLTSQERHVRYLEQGTSRQGSWQHPVARSLTVVPAALWPGDERGAGVDGGRYALMLFTAGACPKADPWYM